jgi:hypothetical protein
MVRALSHVFFFKPGPVRRVPIPNRYTAKAKLCFCKNNKRRIITTRRQSANLRICLTSTYTIVLAHTYSGAAHRNATESHQNNCASCTADHNGILRSIRSKTAAAGSHLLRNSVAEPCMHVACWPGDDESHVDRHTDMSLRQYRARKTPHHALDEGRQHKRTTLPHQPRCAAVPPLSTHSHKTACRLPWL